MGPETPGPQPRVLVQRDPGGVTWLTLNRPAVHNALDFELLAALAGAVAAEGHQAGALVLRGAGARAFSTGFDLRRLTGTAADLEADRAIGEAVDALRQAPVPVVAAIRGHCQGAAVELALTCDLRLGAADLRLAVPAVGLGVVYRPQLVARLMQLGGAGRAADLLLAGATLGAEGALAAGLLTAVVPVAGLDLRAGELARALAAAPRSAVTGTTTVLRRLAAGPLTPAAMAELEAARALAAGSDEHRAAVAAAKARLAGAAPPPGPGG